MKPIKTNLQDQDSDRRIMLFDLALGGHHGSYIRHLIDYWCEQDLSGSLDIVVLPQFLSVHTDVVETISKYKHPKINLIAIAEAETKALNSRKSGFSRVFRNFQEWDLYCQYATSLQATQSLIMYLDTCEIPLSVGRYSPCPFSGIYFRPTFHYSYLPGYQPSGKNKLQHIREKLTLSRILQHPKLNTLFCLDPFAIKHIEQFSSQAKVVYLPDPVEIDCIDNPNLKAIKTNLEIEPHRRVFLLFGALGGRKGIYKLLDAVALLPDELCQQLCLLLVGGTNAIEQAQIEAQVKTISQHKPVQIIQRYQFIPEAEVTAYFQLADLVLAPYQKHAGMSGILLQAAAAGKPVFSSNYGLMGEMVRRYQLGLTVDSSLPEAISQGLTRCLLALPETLGDRLKMEDFVKQNSSDLYGSIIFESLL
jgi:glycosyltransferase involved in cell wall biosynthesis